MYIISDALTGYSDESMRFSADDEVIEYFTENPGREFHIRFEHSTEAEEFDINVLTLFPSGALELSAMKDGIRHAEVFYDYSRAEAIKIFTEQLNTAHRSNNA